MKKVMFWLCVCLLGVDAVLVACSSMSAQQRSDALAQATALQASTATELAHQEALKAAAIVAGDTKAAEKAQKAIDLLGKVKTLVDQGKTTFEASVSPDGSIDLAPVAGTIAGLIPGPWGAGLALLAGVIGTGIQTWRRNNSETNSQANLAAATSILKGLDAAAIADTSVNASLDKAWPTVTAQLTPQAKVLVDTHMVT